LTLVDAFDAGLGWIDDGSVPRTSHALAVDGRVWLIDAVEPADDAAHAVAALGEPAGVIQLLDRHERDCAPLARRLGVPHLHAYAGERGDAPFEFVPLLRRRPWREAALWWPQRRVLVCADVLGTLPYFTAPGEAIGVHPLLRLFPPRALAGFAPERILVGHGEGVRQSAAPALQEALRTSRRRALPAVLSGFKARRDRGGGE
jgi:hypothetical protein